MSQEKPTPQWPFDNENWRKARRLLQTADYELAAELLYTAQLESEQKGQTTQANILAAAHHICLACSHCQAERVWFGQAQAEAEQREAKLKQELDDLLSLLSARETPTEEQAVFSLPASIELKPSAWHVTQPKQRHNFWQHLQRWLGREVKPHSPIQTTPPASIEVLTSPQPRVPSLTVHCLGPFHVYQDDQPVQNWPSSKGKSIFKYLVTHRERPVAKEVLMELFWPEAQPEAARNNLNVAVYGLRQALHEGKPDVSHILFQDDFYLLNPELQIWVDVEAFEQHFKSGQHLEQRGDMAGAVREYRAAEALYQGDFFEEDRYEDWLGPQRQSLQDDYLNLLDHLSHYYLDQADYAACTALCGKMLAVDPAWEEAHRRLIRCYSRQGQRYLALRQYHLCVETLKAELDVSPTPATTTLYEQIRQGRQI